MGYFDDVDVEEIADDPFFVGEGTHVCRITEAITKETTGETPKIGLNLKYIIIQGEYAGNTLIEWLQIPRPVGKKDTRTDEQKANDKKSHSRLKQHFIAFGFGADELKTLTDADLLQREVKVRTVNRPNSYNGITSMRPSVQAVYPVVDTDDSDASQSKSDDVY